MVKRSRRDDLHNTKTQMKLFTAIATAVVLGGSLIATATPASAQYYGGGYGYNNNTRNGYGNDPYASPRRNTFTQKTNAYGRTYMTSPGFNQQCAGYGC